MAHTFKSMSLVRRLTLSYLLAFYFLIGLTSLGLYFAIGSVLDQRMDNDLQEDIIEFSELFNTEGVSAVIQEMDKETTSESDSTFLQLFKSNSQLVHSTPLEEWPGFNSAQEGVDKLLSNVDFRVITMDFEDVDKEARIIYGALSDQYQMIIGESTDEQDDVLELLLLAIVAVFLLSLPIALLLVWGITRRSIAGIKIVSETALQLKRGNLSRRVNAVNEAEEVQTLADTFDSMADRIQQLINDMREMTDNIAHDLRTPISRIRLLSESMLTPSDDLAQYQEKANLAVRECDRLIDLINISLDVSETEAGISLDREKLFDIVEVVEDACDLYDALAEEKAVRISKLLMDRCDIRGDVHSIQRMVANLFDNAVKYSDQGGLISVLMKIEDSHVHITISNTGAVICESEFPKIFNRYYRIDPSRSGDGRGLGLSYARAVARLHGGDIVIKSDRISSVNTFTIILSCDSKH